MVAERWRLDGPEGVMANMKRDETTLSGARCALLTWRAQAGLSVPEEALNVLLLHVVALDGPLAGPEDGLRRALEVLARDEAPLICLEGTPGKLDEFSSGAGYIAARTDAATNLLARVSAAQWAEVRAAAREALEQGAVTDPGARAT